MAHATELLIWGLVLHLIADWLFQNDWMAANKCSLGHPAAWAHGAIHAVMMMFVFPWQWAMLIGLAHMVIDTRKPLTLWRVAFGQFQAVFGNFRDGTELATTVGIWNDQALHIAVVAVAAMFVARLG